MARISWLLRNSCSPKRERSCNGGLKVYFVGLLDRIEALLTLLIALIIKVDYDGADLFNIADELINADAVLIPEKEKFY